MKPARSPALAALPRAPGFAGRALLWRLVLAVAASLCLAAPAAAFDLVTAEEAEADAAAPEPPRMRELPMPGAPRIEVLAPVGQGPVKAPLDLNLRWTALDGASIDTFSVRVLYGRLRLDVTARVLAAARIHALGLEAPGARLPVGEHRLRVEVADDRQRVGWREVTVRIAP